MFRKSDTHIHFVGIGGIGMSGIAEILLDLGYRVTGTDLAESETTRRLSERGAMIHRGHDEAHLGDADVVVISSAVRADNPEVVAARARKIPVIPRAEMLAELMRLKQAVVIAGSHGKTTTTSLVATALHAAGLDPTVVIGGKLNALGSNAKNGRGNLLVAEADESDGSFLLLTPTVAVVTNIDDEHMDHYGSMTRLQDAFVGFANRVPFYGLCVVCLDDPNAAAILPRVSKRYVTYGFSPAADYRAVDVVHDGPTTHFRVVGQGRDLGPFTLHMPGVHNVLNALATIAVCEFHELQMAAVANALAGFDGVQRRFTVRGTAGDVMVVDDYGHHPTEVRATLAGARTSYPDRRLVAVFQAHRYTRVRAHLDGFAASLDAADLVVLTDIYPAGEVPLAGATVEALEAAVRARRPDRPVVVHKPVAGLSEYLARESCPGDLIITLGAGSVTHVSRELAAHLEAPRHLAGGEPTAA
ncbi:UDP-N-acetylmuramate--L-alanine ligase [Nannocystis punicea]|uniref:UDP-N-acetylmuramate--L-alanine ligase n=1 Tax=Nannocystis punicea TaxID=2995304 RepID=A0ABY7H8D9_9BACT|nr:UDP-N-acetylmuramate--L-alanine ligase [Nannocystis poenicansa]WAS95360.1 UDP-N-acetylmuramate--L-alanine ligase [Nannocystis poenicansa]